MVTAAEAAITAVQLVMVTPPSWCSRAAVTIQLVRAAQLPSTVLPPAAVHLSLPTAEPITAAAVSATPEMFSLVTWVGYTGYPRKTVLMLKVAIELQF